MPRFSRNLWQFCGVSSVTFHIVDQATSSTSSHTRRSSRSDIRLNIFCNKTHDYYLAGILFSIIALFIRLPEKKYEGNCKIKLMNRKLTALISIRVSKSTQLLNASTYFYILGIFYQRCKILYSVSIGNNNGNYERISLVPLSYHKGIYLYWEYYFPPSLCTI